MEISENYVVFSEYMNFKDVGFWKQLQSQDKLSITDVTKGQTISE